MNQKHRKYKYIRLQDPSQLLMPWMNRVCLKQCRNGTTIFLIEQNANLALETTHRGYVMENGVITLSNTAANLLANEDIKKRLENLRQRHQRDPVNPVGHLC